MKKAVALIPSAILILALATGCGGNRGGSGTTAPAAPGTSGGSGVVVGFSTGAAGTTFR